MMRFLRQVAVVLVLVVLGTPALAGGNANFILGGRTLSDQDNWEPFDSQGAFGADIDFGRKGWPIHLEAGLQGSAKEETISVPGFPTTTVTASVSEVFFGVNKTWERGNAHPFVGGGVASVTAEFDGGQFSLDDTSGGVYVHGGVFWRIGRRFNIGLDVRALGGTSITFFGIDGDANYTQLGLLLGWGWPAGK